MISLPVNEIEQTIIKSQPQTIRVFVVDFRDKWSLFEFTKNISLKIHRKFEIHFFSFCFTSIIFELV